MTTRGPNLAWKHPNSSTAINLRSSGVLIELVSIRNDVFMPIKKVNVILFNQLLSEYFPDFLLFQKRLILLMTLVKYDTLP